MDENLKDICRKAKTSSKLIAFADTDLKNKVLLKTASLLIRDRKKLLDANNKDLKAGISKNLSEAMLNRLKLNESRIESMALSIEKVAEFEDPVGKVTDSRECENSLRIKRVSVPIGVIGIIYESRPNVTADAASLCLKSGNSCILRPGSESFYSSGAIIDCIHEALDFFSMDKNIVSQLPGKDRSLVKEMITMSDYIDVIIPRGGKGLCKLVMEESRVPVLLHLDGNCHAYVNEDADFDKAIKIIVNAKLRRTEICGALESLVIDKKISHLILPDIAEELISKGCEVRGDAEAMETDTRIKPASEEDWGTEYLDKIISVKIVKDFEEAVSFINKHSSNHTETIITENRKTADFFLKYVDSAIVMHNTSTQFADGKEFGMGSEIGISTGKLHARGPVALEQLTTYKYVVESEGAIRPL